MNKIAGSIFGSAYGDAYGYPTEFRTYQELKHQGFASFPLSYNKPTLISDDTQMALSTSEALLKNYTLFTTNTVDNEPKIAQKIAQEYLIWLHDPKNNRAPGNTCLTALHIYEKNQTKGGYVGEQNHSKGCGANMRNSWFGLLPIEAKTIEHLSIIQSRITHGHPLALSSAVITALFNHEVYNNRITPGEGFTHALDMINQLKTNRSDNYPEKYYEGLILLENFFTSKQTQYKLFINHPETVDYNICDFFGEGWVAEEALLNAIAGFDKLADNPLAGLKRLANSSGDSDSLACIGGAFLGAYAGNIWPETWLTSLEPDYHNRLGHVSFKIQQTWNM